jgi:hypothetical protein
MKKLVLITVFSILKLTPAICQCNTFDCAYNEAKRLCDTSKSVDRFRRALINLDDAREMARNDENKKQKVKQLRAEIYRAIEEELKGLKKYSKKY